MKHPAGLELTLKSDFYNREQSKDFEFSLAEMFLQRCSFVHRQTSSLINTV